MIIFRVLPGLRLPPAAKGHYKLTGLDLRTMRTLNYQLKQLCNNHRDGSYSTQAMRSRMLSLMANQLFELGYRQMQAKSLKPKHVVALTQLWEQQDLSIGTRKNRLATIRWWAARVNKQNVVARDNDQYGLARRQYVTNASRVTTVSEERLDRIKDPFTELSLRLQQAFGLRREEAIKFRPTYAIKNDHLQLKSSWCKGGPVAKDLTPNQRALDKKARALISAELGHTRENITAVYLGR